MLPDHRKTLGKPVNSDDTIKAEGRESLYSRLDVLIATLERAYPDKPSHWYEKLHDKVVFFAKYVGLPSVLLAAIVPSYELIKAFIDHRNTKYVQGMYAQHAQSLLEKGEVDRASLLLADLKDGAQNRVENQYVQAKILAKEALTHGRRQLEAQDRIYLLLSLHKDRPFFFPSLGGRREVFDLELSLVDIDINLQRYPSGKERIRALKESTKNLKARDLEAQVLLREAEIDVLTFNLSSAEQKLASIIPTLQNSGDRGNLAEAHFQLAKALQFQSKTSEALTSYQHARELFEKTSDRQGLLRTYNNLGMLFSAQLDYAKARYYDELQQNLAREIGDEFGLARSLVNLSLVSRHERKYPEALRFAEEALAIFQKENAKLGTAGAHQNLSIINYWAGERPAAIHHGQTALMMFQDLRDLRGVGAMLGLLGEVYRSTRDPLAGGYFLSYIALQRYLSDSPTPDIQRDIDVRMRDLSAMRIELGQSKYASLLPDWLGFVEKMLIPQGITDPVSYLPKELLEGPRD